MLCDMSENNEKSSSEPAYASSPNEDDERDPHGGRGSESLSLPDLVAGSGTLDRLVETARDYAKQAASENTLKAYAKDWAHFTRWCRMKGAESMPPSPEMIGLYLADLAAPTNGVPALS
ncbi:MAG: integrase, partial [Roseovarius sp.]